MRAAQSAVRTGDRLRYAVRDGRVQRDSRKRSDWRALTFGAESTLDMDGGLKEAARPMAENFQCLRAVEPLLIKYRGRIKAVVQEEFAAEQRLHFPGWDIVARFGEFPRNGDCRHKREHPTTGRGRR